MLSQSAENVVTEYSRRSHRKYEVKDVKLINVQDAKEKCHLRLWVIYPMSGNKAERMTKRFRQSLGSGVDPAVCLQNLCASPSGVSVQPKLLCIEQLIKMRVHFLDYRQIRRGDVLS